MGTKILGWNLVSFLDVKKKTFQPIYIKLYRYIGTPIHSVDNADYVNWRNEFYLGKFFFR